MTIDPAAVYTAAQLRQRDAKLVLASICACISVAYAAHTIAGPQQLPQPDPRIERLLRAACHIPSYPGEAATWAVSPDGTLNCWEQRDRREK